MPLARNSILPFAFVLSIATVFILIDTATAVEVSGEGTQIGPESHPAERAKTADTNGLPKPSGDCFILAARSFTIPFSVDQSGATPIEVRLYVSRGTNDWKMVSHQSPDVPVPQFEFAAEGDGEYWFATRTIDADGKPHPDTAIKPQLKVFVDTSKPMVDLVVDASAEGRVNTRLMIRDSTPVQKVIARYVTDRGKTWRDLDADLLTRDSGHRFFPDEGWNELSMQIVATDQAGNQAIVERLIERPRIADLPTHRFSQQRAIPLPTNDLWSTPATAVADPVIQLDRPRNQQVQFNSENAPVKPAFQTEASRSVPGPYGYSAGTGSLPLDNYRGATANKSPQPITPFYLPPSPPTQPNAGSTSGPGFPSNRSPFRFSGAMAGSNAAAAGPRLNLPAPTTDGMLESDSIGLHGPQQSEPTARSPEKIPMPPNGQPDVGNQTRQSTAKPAPRRQPRTIGEAMRPLSEPSTLPIPEKPGPIPEKPAASKTQRRTAARPAPPPEPRAPMRYSDSERFSLDYELQAVGNLGVDSIELYGSTDGGQSWSLWGTDPDRVSPFDIETKEEGVFAFRIVVVGRNGLTSPRPQSGESADIIVVVDKQKPKVRITAAQYGQGNRIGALVIRYECDDPNLGPRPIALSFSDSTNGPWTTIAAGLDNDGDYVWPADPKLPRQIYLRIDAKDGAGNVGSYILDKPIDVQGLAPRARIRGFQSLSGNEAFPTDQQTAERLGIGFQ